MLVYRVLSGKNANFLNLIFILQNEHLIMISEHYSHWFQPRVKTRAFRVLTGFPHFVSLFLGDLEQVLCPSRVLSGQTGWKFS